MKAYNIAIIGAGAAGLMAAQAAKRAGGKENDVVVLEGNQKPGKKLLVTGNGRCNLTNMHISTGHYHGDTGTELAEIISRYPPETIIKAFRELGLLCRADEEGRVYPLNQQAAAVLRHLERACTESGVAFEYGFSVAEVKGGKEGFLIKSETGEEVLARRLILASGGKASPKSSCALNGYELARQLGHSIVPCMPSLVQVQVAEKITKEIKGMRVKARAALWLAEKELHAESGEVIFAEGSLSGICIFNLSAYIVDALRENEAVIKSDKLKISLDLAEGFSKPELVEYLGEVRQKHSALTAINLLSGLLNIKVGEQLIKGMGLDIFKPLSKLTDSELESIASEVKSFSFSVTGLGDYDKAQVTAGGVNLSEIDPNTMESRVCEGLYLAGEILNVNGDCGGYNLHFAWATGLAAAEAVAGK